MPQIIKIRRGTKTELDARGALLSGELGFCTDTKEVYIGDGTANTLVGRSMSGLYSNRPGASGSGRYYYVTSGTNAGYLYVDSPADGAWHRINAKSLADLTGSLDNIEDGAAYGKVKTTELTSGQVNRMGDGTHTVTAAQAGTHINDAASHRQINDSGTALTDLWSAQKIRNEIELAKHNIEPQASVKDQHLTAPPGSPAAGDRYIIPSGATGVWAGQTNKVAEWNGSSWDLYAPATGWTCYVDDEQKVYSWSGSAWVRTGGALQTIGAGSGILVAADAVSVKAYNGITVDANGVAVSIDADSIVYDAANGNRLRVNTIDGGTF